MKRVFRDMEADIMVEANPLKRKKNFSNKIKKFLKEKGKNYTIDDNDVIEFY